MEYLTDRRFMTGIGIGIIITTLCLFSVPGKTYSKSEIEKQAREMGMKYPSEIKLDDLFKK